MLNPIKATAIAITAMSVIGLTAVPASAGGKGHGERYSRTVHITKKVIVERDGRRWKRSRHYRRNGGPPRWAPARGYRNKRHYRRHRPYRHVAARTVYTAPRHSGYVYSDRAVAGGLIGAALGALTGSHIGKGSGRTAAIVGGAVFGAIVGGNIGQSMDRTDAVYTTETLETAQSGNAVTWSNPDSGNQYTVTPTRTYRKSNGQYCREFTTWGWIGGYEQELHGTACRQSDGSWKNVS